jgi:hypothetical protein
LRPGQPGIAKFCLACGAAFAASARRDVEERRVVTVLFVDMVGSTSRAENLDPEDVRAILDRYHRRVRDEIRRVGGIVEKFIGDAVMAVFGAPVAFGDDAERAVRAAFAVRDAVADWREAGDDDRAARYLVVAADDASGGWAKDHAVALYREALALLPDESPARREVGLKLAVAVQAAYHVDDVERLRDR